MCGRLTAWYIPGLCWRYSRGVMQGRSVHVPAAAPPSPLGVELRWMRNAAGLTGKQAADEVGISQVAISRWETGRRQPELDSVEEFRSACAGVIRQRLSGPKLS